MICPLGKSSISYKGKEKKELVARPDIFGLFFYIAQHMTLVSHEEEMIPHPLAATLIWVILFSWAVSWPWCSPPKTSHMWIELSSLEAKIIRPDTEIPEQVHVEA